ncbi:MAG: hypothetical protein Tsb0019_20160 [Roseibium sp.]
MGFRQPVDPRRIVRMRQAQVERAPLGAQPEDTVAQPLAGHRRQRIAAHLPQPRMGPEDVGDGTRKIGWRFGWKLWHKQRDCWSREERPDA